MPQEGLTVQWIWITGGLGLLLAAALLTWLLRRKRAALPPEARPASQVYRRMRLPAGMLAMLRRGARLPADTQDAAALADAALPLMEHLLHLREQLRPIPPLPIGPEGEPRLMEPARDAADTGRFTAEALVEALHDWQESPTPAEVAAFPVYVAVAQSQRLALVLRSIHADAKVRAAAARLAPRLTKAKQPYALLDKAALNSLGLAALARALRESAQPEALVHLDRWLAIHEITTEDLAQQDAKRQNQLAEELRLAESCFSALERLDWLRHGEAADPLHALLLKDPAEVYPRMDAASRRQLRLQIEAFARRVRLDSADVARQALLLCEDAEPRSLERYVGYYFQDAAGMWALRRSLPGRRERLYARLSLRREQVRYGLLWLLGGAAGFGFLHNGGPVFMLPFFAWTVGGAVRFLVRRVKDVPLPRMALDQLPPLRTLVVLPALLHDSHEAIRMVRQLKTARHALPAEGVDCLLLGDFAPGMTAVSSSDGSVIHAAASAVGALEDPHAFYIQRCRTWDGARHTYCARGGRRGAVSEVCRLIAHGECEDVIAYATREPALLERQYDYVLVLPTDRQIAPGMLETLLQTMTHPLCSRYPTVSGWRGFSVLSPEGRDDFEGVGLIRPDAYLEAIDGLVDPALDADALCGELAGHATVHSAHVESAKTPADWAHQYAEALRAWRLAAWQLPWVKTPSGVVNNPLHHLGRFRLREGLRRTLVPLGQFGLLLWAVLTRSWPLLALALLMPELPHFAPRWEALLQSACRLSLLPTQMTINLRALWDVLRRRSAKSPAWVSLEMWAQGLAATVFAALGLVLPAFAVPSLALSVAFACFPLAHRVMDAPVRPAEGLTNEQLALLEDASAATWKFFRRCGDFRLPPCAVQFEPALPPENATSPEAIGAYLLACVCAKDLGYASAEESAVLMRRILAESAALPMPAGLPCRRYALPSLTVLDARVDAAGVGFFAASLMTAAQALRSWLPELGLAYAGLAAEAEKLLAALDLTALYDPEAGLFHAALDENGQGDGYVTRFADGALLLGVAACARKAIPPSYFQRLNQTRVRTRHAEMPLSQHGTASEHLLAGLFLPLAEAPALAFVEGMAAAGQDGLFGQDASGLWAFDAALRYQQSVFGLQTAAVQPTGHAPVYAPYAAALCLPYAPRLAAGALARFDALGALGPDGFCDAVDLTNGPALVGLHDTLHQGLLLVSAAHLLADTPLRRYFCALPEVEACLPLLAPRPSAVLPSLPVRRRFPAPEMRPERTADPLLQPVPAHLLGDGGFHLIVDAHGNSAMFDGDVPLTRTSPDEAVQGVQFYLADEGRIYRLGDPLLQGETVFAAGEARCTRLCGSLRAELTAYVDAIRRRALHVVTITNLSTRDRLVELADFLLPDLAVPRDTLEPTRPTKGRLTVHARSADRTLHHTLDASQPPLALATCTDALAFLGRGRTLRQPASLEEPLHDLPEPGLAPCLAFRARFSLGGRGQLTLWFTTSLADSEPPLLTELPGIRQLAAMQHAAIDASAALSETQRQSAERLITPIFRAGCRLAFLLRDADDAVLADLLAILGWLLLHGLRARLTIVCPEEAQAALTGRIAGCLAEEQVDFLRPADFTPAEFSLVLTSDAPLADQLDALAVRLIPPEPSQRPKPALLPRKELRHPCAYGGFDPETQDYVVQLEPGQTTPAPWRNRHVSRYFCEEADESGLRAPFFEQVWLQLPDGARLSPWDAALPRAVRMRPGETDWEAWSDQLDLRLRAACLPGHRCGLRALHVHNATDGPLTLRITVLARLSAPLACTPGLVITDAPERRLHSYLTGPAWSVRRVNAAHGALADQPPLSLPDDPNGDTALLSCDLPLEPRRSAKVLWLAGYARHGEDVARALTQLQSQGASAHFRAAQTPWTQRLTALTFSTPEDTLDLLLNRILPVQALCADGLDGVPALTYLAPTEARRALLRQMRRPMSRDEWAHFALLTTEYVRVTGDSALLLARVFPQDASLLDCCKAELTAVPLDRQLLPQGEDQARRCFLYALAAQALDAISPDPALAEFSRKLLNAADTYLWQEGYYGDPLRLDVQCLACAACGANPRTRQAVSACWTALYDREHGLIRSQEATDTAPLPGLPQNGGMVTREAVRCLRALLRTEHREEAFELLRALNPIHHTDDPLRMETFRCAPYQLHGGMCASPMEAGRAVPAGGDEAAALLYSVILTDVLGLHREGRILRLTPTVPADWDDFSLTLREGASTWHISAERRIDALTVDGETIPGDAVTLTDDGKVHQVRFPLA